MYKFEKLEVYQMALSAPKVLDGRPGQSNAVQNRFLGLALRSYLETIACLDIIRRRNYLSRNVIADVMKLGHGFFVKLQALRKALAIPVPDPRSPVKEVPVASPWSPVREKQ